MGEEQVYRLNYKLRRRGESALDQHDNELKSEDFNSDEEFCLAAAEQVLEMIRADREYLNEVGEE